MSADTGVGPSIASGNHTCSGNCADLPTAPQKISRPTIVKFMLNESSPSGKFARKYAKSCGAFLCAINRSCSDEKLSDPSNAQSAMIPKINPKSPNRFVMKAFFAASTAEAFPYQNPISKYDDTPTSSQKMNNCRKLFASTMPSIENVNKLRHAKKRE